MFWLLLTIFLLISLIYWLLCRHYKYWTNLGVKQGMPKLFFGESWGTLIRQQSLTEMLQMIYSYGGPTARYAGAYQFLTPNLVLKDPELIKQITVKDFDHFVDHRDIIPEDVDPLWSKNLFSLNGQRWKEMRATVSPVFTSSKMKFIFELIAKNGQQFVDFFLEKNENLLTLEFKDIFTRFTSDVIANAAFGIECDSLKDPQNEFYMMGKEATDFRGFWRNFKMFAFFTSPELFKYFKMTFVPRHVTNFFHKLIQANLATRRQLGIVRPDMLHVLLQAQKNLLKHDESRLEDTGFATVQEVLQNTTKKAPITDDDITSQALVFFFAGFDAVSNLMCFLAYELVVNPDIQKTLTDEVDETFEMCNGQLSYDALFKMRYLDMVVSELLRKWALGGIVDRVCTKPYTIEPKCPYEKPLHLKPKDVLLLPIYAIHRDPKFWHEPERFDPERFNDENKSKIVPYTYIPFGTGPRNCIASRFVLLEVKVLCFYILRHFHIVPVEKTQIPIRLSKKQFNLTSDDGFWFGLERRF